MQVFLEYCGFDIVLSCYNQLTVSLRSTNITALIQIVNNRINNSNAGQITGHRKWKARCWRWPAVKMSYTWSSCYWPVRLSVCLSVCSVKYFNSPSACARRRPSVRRTPSQVSSSWQSDDERLDENCPSRLGAQLVKRWRRVNKMFDGDLLDMS